MPRKPRVTHPLRDLRTVLNMTQPAFAKFVGCSAITIQRIENRTLKMSHVLADKILEATGVNPRELAAGRKAVDVEGNPYTKQSYEDYKKWIEQTHHGIDYYRFHLSRLLDLLLISSERAGHAKLHSVNAALGNAFEKIAEDFSLRKNIDGFLIENGFVRKRTYLVRDLRKFPEYARIIGYKDNKRINPDKKISYEIPFGWMTGFDQLVEQPVFPKEIEKKLADKDYVIDMNKPIPDTPEFKDLNEAMPKVIYWKIKKFFPTLSGLKSSI
jgi:transcriptional regulator with XRE-family HTH domain